MPKLFMIYHILYLRIRPIDTSKYPLSVVFHLVCIVYKHMLINCSPLINQLDELLGESLAEVDWRKSFYLNMVAHTSFTVTVAICR